MKGVTAGSTSRRRVVRTIEDNTVPPPTAAVKTVPTKYRADENNNGARSGDAVPTSGCRD